MPTFCRVISLYFLHQVYCQHWGWSYPALGGRKGQEQYKRDSSVLITININAQYLGLFMQINMYFLASIVALFLCGILLLSCRALLFCCVNPGATAGHKADGKHSHQHQRKEHKRGF